MAAFQVQQQRRLVGLNVAVCLGGLKQRVHSDACLALLQSANYLFILDSTQRHLFMMLNGLFCCSRDR